MPSTKTLHLMEDFFLSTTLPFAYSCAELLLLLAVEAAPGRGTAAAAGAPWGTQQGGKGRNAVPLLLT